MAAWRSEIAAVKAGLAAASTRAGVATATVGAANAGQTYVDCSAAIAGDIIPGADVACSLVVRDAYENAIADAVIVDTFAASAVHSADGVAANAATVTFSDSDGYVVAFTSLDRLFR